MFNLLKKNFSPALNFNSDSPQTHWLSAATLALGFTLGLALLLPAHAAVQRSIDNTPVQNLTDDTLSNSGPKPGAAPVVKGVSSLRPLRDGVYLYGDATSPEQQKSTYFVFEVRGRQVVGALYSPRSSFDCFYGNLNANNLDVRVFDTYDANFYPQAVNLSDYHALPQVSHRDQKLIQACRASAPSPAQLQAGKSLPLR